MVEISVVVPVYDCERCLRHLVERLHTTLGRLTESYELVFVDDRSRDDGWRVLRELARDDPRIRTLRLSRNFGQHAAITAGLEAGDGRWTVVMDCDLQDPPEEIERLYVTAQEGYDIVFTRRVGRRHPWHRRIASRLYFWILNRLLGTSLDAASANFSIVSRQVRDAFLRIRDKDRHYLMILHWLGFEHTTVDVRGAERYAGDSAYTFAMLVRFALAGLFFQTTTLLRWIIYAGFTISALGAGLAVFYVVNYFVGTPYAGWTTLGVLLLVLGGFIIVSTGVAGLYVGKIFTQVKDRPLYVLDDADTHAAADERVPLTRRTSG